MSLRSKAVISWFFVVENKVPWVLVDDVKVSCFEHCFGVREAVFHEFLVLADAVKEVVVVCAKIANVVVVCDASVFVIMEFVTKEVCFVGESCSCFNKEFCGK